MRRAAAAVVITGPIGAGKNTVADLLAMRWRSRGRQVAVVDLDDVAAATARHDWAAAHRVHGAVVAAWLREGVDVLAVGPVIDAEEQRALLSSLPPSAPVVWVVIDADVTETLARVHRDPGRVLSKEPAFHRERHDRFRRLLDGIPRGPRYDSTASSAEDIAAALADRLESSIGDGTAARTV